MFVFQGLAMIAMMAFGMVMSLFPSGKSPQVKAGGKMIKRGGSVLNNSAAKKEQVAYDFQQMMGQNLEKQPDYEYPFDEGWKCHIF